MSGSCKQTAGLRHMHLGLYFSGAAVPRSISASPCSEWHNLTVIDNVRADGKKCELQLQSSGDAGEIKADGPIASYLCVASSSLACGIMDHYCLLRTSTNMLLNLVPKAYGGWEETHQVSY